MLMSMYKHQLPRCSAAAAAAGAAAAPPQAEADASGLSTLVDAQMTWPARTHGAGTLREADAGKEITVCGWVDRNRNMGGLCFLDVRDHTGLLQVRAVRTYECLHTCMNTCVHVCLAACVGTVRFATCTHLRCVHASGTELAPWRGGRSRRLGLSSPRRRQRWRLRGSDAACGPHLRSPAPAPARTAAQHRRQPTLEHPPKQPLDAPTQRPHGSPCVPLHCRPAAPTPHQVVGEPQTHPEASRAAARLRSEYVVAVTGQLRVRKDPNPKLPTGGVELLATSMRCGPAAALETWVCTTPQIRIQGQGCRIFRSLS
jgi:hypothetical protein